MLRRYKISSKHLSRLSLNKLPSNSQKQLGLLKEKAKLDFSWVSVFSLSITVFTAVLFGAGKAYRQAYLFTYGFDDSVIPWSFQDLVYKGVTTQLVVIIATPFVAILLVAAFTIFFTLGILIKNKLRKSTKANNGKSEKNEEHRTLFEILDFLGLSFSAILVFAFLAIFFVARAEGLGNTEATAELKEISLLDTKSITLPKSIRFAVIERSLGKQKIIEQGFVVSCNDQACALYMPDRPNESSRIVPLNFVTTFKYLKIPGNDYLKKLELTAHNRNLQFSDNILKNDIAGNNHKIVPRQKNENGSNP